MRGIWLDAMHALTEAAITTQIERFKRAMITDVFFELHGTSGAMYNTSYIPKIKSIGTFDPLATMIRLGHAAGIRVHGWMHTYWLSAWYPQYEINGRTGVPADVYSADFSAGFQTLMANIATDLLAHYQVDGYHHDGIRLPGPETGLVASTVSSIANVTATVAAVKSAIGSRATITAAVRRQGYLDCLQNWPDWITGTKKINYAIPMCYRDLAKYVLLDFATWDKALYPSIVPGIAVMFETTGYPVKTLVQFKDELDLCSSYFGSNVVMFNAGYMTDEMVNYLTKRNDTAARIGTRKGGFVLGTARMNGANYVVTTDDAATHTADWTVAPGLTAHKNRDGTLALCQGVPPRFWPEDDPTR